MQEKRTSYSTSDAPKGAARLQTPEAWRKENSQFVSDNEPGFRSRAKRLIEAGPRAVDRLLEEMEATASRCDSLLERIDDTGKGRLEWLLALATLRSIRTLRGIVHSFAKDELNAADAEHFLIEAQRRCAETFWAWLVDQRRDPAADGEELKALSVFARSRLAQYVTLPDGRRTATRLKRHISLEKGGSSAGFEEALAENMPLSVWTALSEGGKTIHGYDQLQNRVARDIEQLYKPVVEEGREKKANTGEYDGDTTMMVEELIPSPEPSPETTTVTRMMANHNVSELKRLGLTDKDISRLRLAESDLTNQEAADLMNEPIETFKKGIHRARKKFKNISEN